MNITVTTVDTIGIVTLSNSAHRNALSKALVDECLAAFEALHCKHVRVVVLRAEADAKVWSAGHDINELVAGEDPLHYADPLEQLLREIKSFPAPVIAMVHGSVWGGATEVAVTCDLLVGDETCSFAITPAKLGLAYNTAGLLEFIRRLPINLVREMLYTGQPVNAQESLRWGILNHLVPAAQLESFTLDLARGIAQQSALEVSTVKQQLRTMANALPLSPSDCERIEELRRTVYQSADFREGLAAFHERRSPTFVDSPMG